MTGIETTDLDTNLRVPELLRQPLMPWGFRGRHCRIFACPSGDFQFGCSLAAGRWGIGPVTQAGFSNAVICQPNSQKVQDWLEFSLHIVFNRVWIRAAVVTTAASNLPAAVYNRQRFRNWSNQVRLGFNFRPGQACAGGFLRHDLQLFQRDLVGAREYGCFGF